MPEKPTTAAGYDGTQLELVRQALLCVATRLGDVLEQLTVVGGLVPSLLIDPTDLPAGVAPHVGTRDLDLGLQLAVLNEASYRSLAEDTAKPERLVPSRGAAFLQRLGDGAVRTDLAAAFRALVQLCAV